MSKTIFTKLEDKGNKMNLEEIKAEANKNMFNDLKSLSIKVRELKNKGASFLACVAFVQFNQKLTLKEAKDLTLKIDVYNNSEKKKIENAIETMLSDFKEE